ncbi:hypothetical protein NC652_021714 [Populus alba x Populus x berolinensis]|nr:hypothetical protein NC652_021714 [Populus alba x Populus x berolinensis]
MENMQKHQHGAPVSTKISFLDCIDLSTPDIQRSFSLTNRVGVFGLWIFFFLREKPWNKPIIHGGGINAEDEKHRRYIPVLDELLDPDNQLHVGDYKERGITLELKSPKMILKLPVSGLPMKEKKDIFPGLRRTT